MWQNINDAKRMLVLRSKMEKFGEGDTDIIWVYTSNDEIILSKFSEENGDIIYHNAKTGEPINNIIKMHNYPVIPQKPHDLILKMNTIEAIKHTKNIAVKNQQYEIACILREAEKTLIEKNKPNENKKY